MRVETRNAPTPVALSVLAALGVRTSGLVVQLVRAPDDVLLQMREVVDILTRLFQQPLSTGVRKVTRKS
jgi:hypothetical protein